MHIGEKIAFHRKGLNMTQKDLASGICSIPYLSKLEHNKLEANDEVLALICERLQLNLEDLVVDDFTSYMNQLRHLYTLVNKRDVESASMSVDLLKELRDSMNPMISTAYYIVLLVHEVTQKNEQEATKIKHELLNRYNYIDQETQIWYYKTLGYYEYVFGNIERSAEHFYTCEQFLEDESKVDPQLEYLLGLVNTRLMLVSKSTYHTERALDFYSHQTFDLKKIVECKIMLAINYMKVGYYDLAEEQYLNLFQLLKTDYKNEKLLGTVQHNLGYLYLLVEKDDQAVTMFEEALTVFTTPTSQVETLYLLAYLYKKQGDLEGALQLCDRALEASEQSNLQFHYKSYILKQSINFQGFNDPEFLNRLEFEIIPYFIEQEPAVAKECLILLGDSFSKLRKYKRATDYYQQVVQLNPVNYLREVLY